MNNPILQRRQLLANNALASITKGEEIQVFEEKDLSGFTVFEERAVDQMMADLMKAEATGVFGGHKVTTDDIRKAREDAGKLEKKVVKDKNGGTRTVYVKVVDQTKAHHKMTHEELMEHHSSDELHKIADNYKVNHDNIRESVEKNGAADDPYHNQKAINKRGDVASSEEAYMHIKQAAYKKEKLEGKAGAKATKDVNKPYKPGEKEEDIKKAEFSDKERKKLAKEGEAEENGSYPIENEEDLKNAIQAYGRSKNKVATKRWIKKRAKELDKESLLPDSWSDKIEKAIDALIKGDDSLIKAEGFDENMKPQLERKQIIDKNGHSKTVYVRHWDTEEHHFAVGHKVHFTHKDGSQGEGDITAMKYHHKYDKYGTATIRDKEGNEHSRSLLKVENHKDNDFQYDTSKEDKGETKKDVPGGFDKPDDYITAELASMQGAGGEEKGKTYRKLIAYMGETGFSDEEIMKKLHISKINLNYYREQPAVVNGKSKPENKPQDDKSSETKLSGTEAINKKQKDLKAVEEALKNHESGVKKLSDDELASHKTKKQTLTKIIDQLKTKNNIEKALESLQGT
ncbi:MAG: hypothetical protein JO370_14135, partial [Paucibacter sp.]|nr:hypothetical protein [Roseateles sp.]